MTEEEKIFIPIPAEQQEMHKEFLEAQKKLRDSIIALQNNPDYIKREKGRLALKKIEKLKADYGKQKVGDVKFTMDALLREIEKISFSDRTKIDKNNRTVTDDTGISYNTQKKYLNALRMYEKLVADGVSRPTAKGKVRKYNGWKSIKVTEKMLTKARKLRKNQNLPQK